MKISLIGIERDGFVKVEAEGAITAANFTTDKSNPLEGVLGRQWTTNKILLDLGHVDYIDSSAVGWLIGTQRQMKAGGGVMVIHSIQPRVQQILDVLRVSKAVPIAANEDDARTRINSELQQGAQ